MCLTKICEIVIHLLRKVLEFNFVNRNQIYTLCKWLCTILISFVIRLVILSRIFIAVIFRILFGTWLNYLNVVPFQVHSKDNYVDPGVIEMHALLRGEDCFDIYLEQTQKLPFPPPEYDPYNKIYLAVYFNKLLRIIQTAHVNLNQHGGRLYQGVINLPLFRNFIRYISTSVAININE